MKILLTDATKHFNSPTPTPTPNDPTIITFIQTHPFYQPTFPLNDLLKQIKQNIKSSKQNHHYIKNMIQQLGLYLSKQNNRLIFQIYEIVLRNPDGITYQEISKKTKLEIYNISHYCCRLKKMNFVKLQHNKSQKKVYPKDSPPFPTTTKDKDKDTTKDPEFRKKNQDDQDQPQQSISKPFHFNQLSIVDNIWINISSYQSYKKNGVTNEEVKYKLSKLSQTKLIMKLVQQMKDIYGFNRQMLSKGKVFVHRYKNITKNIQNSQLSPPNTQPQITQILNPHIQKWLKQKYPQYTSQKFLFHFINQQLTGYLSASGLKSVRRTCRTCTPIKLIRYIKILNSLNNHWPQTYMKLKKFIIDQEKTIPNGTMHKRSIVGILDGLVDKGILRKQQPYYFPLWEPEGEQIHEQQENQLIAISKPKKKVHLCLDSLENKKEVGKKMTVDQYKKQLRIRLFCVYLQQIYKTMLRKIFKRIILTKKSKTGIKIYEPQLHIFHILDCNFPLLPKISAQNYQQFIQKVDEFIQNEGHEQKQINVSYQIIKEFRKYPIINENKLQRKFGNNWIQKIQPLIDNNVVGKDKGNGWVVKDEGRYFL